MNIFRYWDMVQHTENARIVNHVNDKLVILDHEAVRSMNARVNTNWNQSCKNDIYKLLQFGNNQSKCVIPYRLVQFCRLYDESASQCFCVLRYKDELIGILQVVWGDQYVYNYTMSKDSSERCCTAEITSRSVFRENINLKNVDIPNYNGVSYIPLLDKTYIMKQKDHIKYDSDNSHNIGFVKQEIKCKFNGDYKEFYNVKGHGGASCKYCCLWCYCTIKQITEDPDPANRCANPRHYGDELEILSDVERNVECLNDTEQNHYVQTYGLKYPAVCKIYQHVLSTANVHLFGGKCGRYINAIKCIFYDLDKFDSELIEKYDTIREKIYYLKSEIVLLRKYLKQVNDFNVENRKDLSNTIINNDNVIDDSDDIVIRSNSNNNSNNSNNNSNNNIFNWNMGSPNNSGSIRPIMTDDTQNKRRRKRIDFNVNKSESFLDGMVQHHENFDGDASGDESDSDIENDLDSEYIEYQINSLNDELKLVMDKKSDLENQMNVSSDRMKLWNEYKSKAKFEELDYRDNEITGPNALKFVESWEYLESSLKSINPRAAEICKYLFPCLSFLLHSSCHKNYLPLSDEFIKLHKFVVIQEEFLGKLLIKVSKKIDESDTVASGYKGHVLYHEHCRMEYTRMTGAHFDDQRPENVCKMCKCYIRMNRNQLNKVRMRNMIMKMNCEHCLYYDVTGTW